MSPLCDGKDVRADMYRKGMHESATWKGTHTPPIRKGMCGKDKKEQMSWVKGNERGEK